MNEIHVTPLLSVAEEHELANRVAAGDPEARDHLVRANLRLVVNIAKRYLKRGVSIEDLIAEGNLGLIRASEGYDGREGVRFSTYASLWIKQSIRSAIIKQGKFIRLPLHAVTAMSKWKRASAALATKLGRDPNETEVGDALGLDECKRRLVCQALDASALVIHGESNSRRDSDEGDILFDGVVDHHEKSAEDQFTSSETEERILGRVNRLDPRGAGVVRMRFGLNGEDPLSLREVGQKLGLTRERIRQLEKKALVELSV